MLAQALFWLGWCAGQAHPEWSVALAERGRSALAILRLNEINNPWLMAAVIFAWNASFGLLLSAALPNLVFGMAAVLMPLRFVLLGVTLAQVSGRELLWHQPTLWLELSAYALMGWAGTTSWAQLWAARNELDGPGLLRVLKSGARVTWRAIPPALALLLAGAMYEGVELLILGK